MQQPVGERMVCITLRGHPETMPCVVLFSHIFCGLSEGERDKRGAMKAEQGFGFDQALLYWCTVKKIIYEFTLIRLIVTGQ